MKDQRDIDAEILDDEHIEVNADLACFGDVVHDSAIDR